MKKYLVLFVVLALVLLISSCSVKEEAPAYSSEYEQACFDIGGLMGTDGCVLQVETCPQVSVSPDAQKAPASDCKARAKELGAPDDIVTAICSAVPTGQGVSQRLPSGTFIEIGSITFDSEDRVWFLMNFTTPATANYAFSYKGAEQSVFTAPFVLGSELGYGENDTRVPFKICYSVVGDCTPPEGVNLFPTK